MNDQRFLDQALLPSRVRAWAPMGTIATATAPFAVASPAYATTTEGITKPNLWLGGDECAKGRTFHDGTGRLTPDDLARST